MTHRAAVDDKVVMRVQRVGTVAKVDENAALVKWYSGDTGTWYGYDGLEIIERKKDVSLPKHVSVPGGVVFLKEEPHVCTPPTTACPQEGFCFPLGSRFGCSTCRAWWVLIMGPQERWEWRRETPSETEEA